MLVILAVNFNKLTGSIPSISANTKLKTFYCHQNQLTGSIPSLVANTDLESLFCFDNQLSGDIPSLWANSKLTTFRCDGNRLTGFDTTRGPVINNGMLQTPQPAIPRNLLTFQANNNLLTEAAVDAILAECRALYINAFRMPPTKTINLGGTGNAAPSTQGQTDKQYLRDRGWTVTTN
jgi:Leucine-rich repeat (LRR) protein